MARSTVAPDRLDELLRKTNKLSDQQFASSSQHISLLVSEAAAVAATSQILQVLGEDERGLDDHEEGHISPSTSLFFRKLLFTATRRLAKLQDTAAVTPFKTSLLLDLSATYARSNAKVWEEFVDRVLEASPQVKQEIQDGGVKAFTDLLRKLDDQWLSGFRKGKGQGQAGSVDDVGKEMKDSRRLAYTLHSFVSCPSVARIFSSTSDARSTRDFLSALVEAYDVHLPRIARDNGLSSDSLVESNGAFKPSPPVKTYLRTRIDLLQTAYSCLNSLPPSPSTSRNDYLVSISESQTRFSSSLSRKVSLFNLTLLQDLDYFFDVISDHQGGKGGKRDERIDRLKSQIPPKVDIINGIDALRPPPPPSVAPTATSLANGTDLQIAQVQDVLPTLSPSQIRTYLQHPQFSSATNPVEALIEASLEDRLPRIDDTTRGDVVGAKSGAGGTERRNIFSDPMDVGKLTKGKTKATADALLKDRSFLTETMKESIIRLAEAPSSDEEDADEEKDDEWYGDNRRRVREAAFLEDFGDEDDDLGPAEPNARVRSAVHLRDGDLEELEDEEDVEADGETRRQPSSSRSRPVLPATAPVVSDPITPRIRRLLETAYASDPAVFARTSAARKSKARADIRKETGCDDGILEGWAVMLERNPKKDKILAAATEFTGNRPSPAESEDDDGEDDEEDTAGRSDGQGGRGGRGGQRGGGGGGGGRGRGRGRGGEGSDRGGGGRGRGRGGGNRAAHQRRQRGHDKKMARGGAFGA